MKARVKLGELLVLAVAAPLYGQHGVRLGSDLAFLTQSSDGPDPQTQGDSSPLSGLPPALAEALRDQAVKGLSTEQMVAIRAVMAANQRDAQSAITERRANTTGVVFPWVTNPDGSKLPLLFTPRLSVAFDTWAEQRSSDYAESVRTGFTGIQRGVGKAVLGRFVRDISRHIYVSYSATVETLPEEGTYRVTLGPSSDGPPADLPAGADWRVLSPAKYPVPQIVKDGDSIRLELYAPDPSKKLVDYVHAGRQDRISMRAEPPRDSYADDAELVLKQPMVRVNGVSTALAAIPETTHGPLLWIYVPSHGRYVLSLQPHLDMGFENAGEASGNSLSFTAVDGNVFRIDSAERIAVGSGSYIVHVLPDQGWKPADTEDRDRVMIGSQMAVN